MGNLKSKSKIYIEVQRAKNSQDTSEKKKQDIKLLLHYYKIVVIKTTWLAWD